MDNIERRKITQRKYYENNKIRLRAQKLKYYQKNKEKQNKKHKKW